MSAKDTLDIKRNRVEITDIDRERGYCWVHGWKVVLPEPCPQYLEIAVLSQMKVTMP